MSPRNKHPDEHLQHHQLFQADTPFHDAKAAAAILRERTFLQLLLGFRQVERQFAHFDKSGERTGTKRQYQRDALAQWPVINGVGDVADVGGTGNLCGNPQTKQQHRFDQHAKHRFTARADSGKRATGIQTRNGKEETRDGEEIQ